MMTESDNTYYVNPEVSSVDMDSLDREHREVLASVNRRLGALGTVEEVIDMLFEETSRICGGDRIGMAFFDESGERLVSHHVRAGYEPVRLGKGYTQELRGSSLEDVIDRGYVRIIDDLSRYLEDNPGSVSTALLVEEGVRSSMSCPLKVDGRPVGVLFRSSRIPGAFDEQLAGLHLLVAERMGQTVEKAYRIEQLEQANRAYMEMLGFVVHELKSPLAGIVTNAQVILQGYLGDVSDKQRPKLEKIVDRSEHLLGLIGEYLSLARMEGGELETDPVQGVDLAADVVAPVMENLRARADRRGITLEADFPDEPVVLECDPGLMGIAAANLLGNGVKYAHDGALVKATISEEGDAVRLEVFNEGPGFPLEKRDKLFRRFSRIDTAELMSRKGTGVGLYTTAKIVRKHRGRLGAASQEGEWARFWFEIPRSSGARRFRS